VNHPAALLLVSCCIAIETTEQSLYRMAGRNRHQFLYRVAPAIVLHMVGLLLWYWLLKYMPLGQALPLMGANFVAIALVGRFIFCEEINWPRWAGIALILCGFVLVAAKSS
jgi:multidrug transporter EmrE-like cation transporter